MFKDDVDLTSARLFTDIFYLYYMYNQTVFGINSYSLALSFSARSDVRNYFQNCIETTIKLQNKTVDVLLEKGLFIRAPYLPKPDKVDFVDSKKYLKGFIGNIRTINAIEIMHVYNNVQNNHIGHNIMTAFRQVSTTKEVGKFMEQGKKISANHINKLRQVLLDSDVTLSSPWDYGITDSTTPPFSDKLMMFLTTVLLSGGLANYGISLAQSTRKDLGLMYATFMTEVGDLAEDGANIMIKNRWLEKIPQALNRKELIKK